MDVCVPTHSRSEAGAGPWRGCGSIYPANQNVPPMTVEARTGAVWPWQELMKPDRKCTFGRKV